MKLPKLNRKEKGPVARASSVTVYEDGSREIPAGTPLDVLNNASGVLQIGKKRYAVDLFRTRMPETSIKDEAALIKPIGLAETWTLYAGIPNNKVAFGSSGIGHKKGQIPLAESIRKDLLGDNWIVVIPLDGDKFWIGRMEDGDVTGDEVFTDKNLAEEEIFGEYVTPDRPIVAPPEWGITGSTNARLSDLIGRKTPALRKFGFIRNNLPRIIFFLIVLGVAGGTYSHFKAQKERMLSEQRDLEERRKKRVVVQDSDYPWFQKVRPEEFLIACAEMFNESLRTVPGWTGQPIVCQYANGKAVATLSYTRQVNGRIGWMREAYEGSEGVVSLDASGNNVSYSVSHDLVASEEGFRDIKPWSSNNVQRVLMERFQNSGLSPNISTNASKTPEPARDRATFNSHSLLISTGGLPIDVARLMADIPAVVPQSLIWDEKSNQWTLDVSVYHEAILPLGAI